jgi:hypothetical protein
MALTQVSTGGIKDGQVHTADLADAQITAGKLHADALDRTYTLGADGSNHYTFTGEGLTGAVNDPTLYLTRGKTYRFVNGNSAGAHPFRIQTTVNGSAGTEYNTGVTNNGGAGGSTIVFEVPHAAPDVLYYQCTSHGSMGGIFYITGALPDGGVTTAKLADDAVTNAKLGNDSVGADQIANNSITTSELADDAVDTNAIQNNAVTTAKIADAQITSAKLGTSAVTTGKINDQAVTAAKIADTTITSGQLAASSVTASKINDGAVTNAKIDTMAASKLTGDLPAISGANLTGIQGIPSGVIMLWSGASNAIPSGFVLCDGNNSTPDLRNRFVVGATDTYSVGATGGATTDSITATGNTTSQANQQYNFRPPGNNGGIYAAMKVHSHSVSVTATVDTVPPYYALCYIMKT